MDSELLLVLQLFDWYVMSACGGFGGQSACMEQVLGGVLELYLLGSCRCRHIDRRENCDCKLWLGDGSGSQG